jgi:2-oxo-4-hydroxy-4-carboxy-5-ureidoimidazoline decarboxylase
LTIAEFNALPAQQADAALRSVCGSGRWVRELSARRPFRSLHHLIAEADAVWQGVSPADWDEAFAHHPRIGERQAQAAVSAAAAGWSVGEQAGAAAGDAAVKRAIAAGNAEYERRFGRVYIVCASGRSAEEILADLQSRLDNTPERELATAAREQAAITTLRLRKLIDEVP